MKLLKITFTVLFLFVASQAFADGDCSKVSRVFDDPVPSLNHTISDIEHYQMLNPEGQKYIVTDNDVFFIDCGNVFRRHRGNQKTTYLKVSNAIAIVYSNESVLALDKENEADLIVKAGGEFEAIELNGDFIEIASVGNHLILLNDDHQIVSFGSARKGFGTTFIYIYNSNGTLSTIVPVMDSDGSTFKESRLTRVSTIKNKNTTNPIFHFQDKGNISYAVALQGKLFEPEKSN